MNGRLKNLARRIERLDKRTVARDDVGVEQYLTQQQLEVLAYADKMELAAKAARSKGGDKE